MPSFQIEREMKSFLIIPFLVFSFSFSYAQNVSSIHYFNVYGDSSLNFDRVYFGPKDTTKGQYIKDLNTYFDKHGIISIYQAYNYLKKMMKLIL